jgi:hypothetical protein
VPFSLEVFAVHLLEIGGSPPVVARGSASRSELPAEAIERIERYVADIDARDEGLGNAVSVWWEGRQPAELAALGTCLAGDFGDAALDAVARLSGLAPATAASGVIVFVRGVRDGGTGAVAIFKMAPHALEVTQFDPAAAPADAITKEQLVNILPEPKELAKAAITPSPSTTAPLRVVDRVTRDEPADYWLRFLGAQQLPRQPRLVRMLLEAGQGALEAAGVEQHAAREVMARQVGALASQEAPIEPRVFLDRVAADAGRSTADLWQAATRSEPDLAKAHLQVTPTAAERLKTTFDLGAGIVLTGPVAAMSPPRVEIGQDGGGWFVKVRTTAEPMPRTR